MLTLFFSTCCSQPLQGLSSAEGDEGQDAKMILDFGEEAEQQHAGSGRSVHRCVLFLHKELSSHEHNCAFHTHKR